MNDDNSRTGRMVANGSVEIKRQLFAICATIDMGAALNSLELDAEQEVLIQRGEEPERPHNR